MTILQPELVYMQITIPENRKKFVKFEKIRLKFEQIKCLHSHYCDISGYYMQCGVIGIPKSSRKNFKKFNSKLSGIFENMWYSNVTFYNIFNKDKLFEDCHTYYLHCTVNNINNSHTYNNKPRMWCSIGKDNIYSWVTLLDKSSKNIKDRLKNQKTFKKGDWIDICIKYGTIPKPKRYRI